MNRSSNSLPTMVFCMALGLAALVPSTHAQPAGGNGARGGIFTGGTNYDILVANGVAYFPGAGGDPATLGNVIDHIFRARFTQATFILAPGLEKLMVGDLKVAYPSQHNGIHIDECGIGLEAVRMATSNAFTINGRPGGVYLLEPSQSASKKTVAAFNLSKLGQDINELFAERRHAGMDLETRLQEFGKGSPSIKAASDRVALLTAEIDDDAVEKEKLVKLAQEQVKATLDTLRLPDSPEFNYNSTMHLLVVVGTDDQIDVTRTILDALLGNPAPPREKVRKDLLDDLPAPQPNLTPPQPK
jgi:hypothetical protein